MSSRKRLEIFRGAHEDDVESILALAEDTFDNEAQKAASPALPSVDQDLDASQQPAAQSDSSIKIPPPSYNQKPRVPQQTFELDDANAHLARWLKPAADRIATGATIFTLIWTILSFSVYLTTLVAAGFSMAPSFWLHVATIVFCLGMKGLELCDDRGGTAATLSICQGVLYLDMLLLLLPTMISVIDAENALSGLFLLSACDKK
ncbi:hypothetical protein IWX90DRAFT_424815 [Phyllosticta citrichinensis]|uniref:Transmembrane protein n=1 Tax=Phyllosticta citrichinensis TaxID=1130410 RepID=A0ABR1Y3N1_9PEZI